MSRDWTPVRSRNGKTYCSPACGAGCTYDAYEAAVLASFDLARKCTEEIGGKWTTRVHENLGWHWYVVQEGTGISISFGGYLAQGTKYSVGFLGGTPCQVALREDFNTPKEAYVAQVEEIKKEADKWNSILNSVPEPEQAKSKIRKDVFGIEPKIGDSIAFNPAKRKGLIIGTCKGFAKSGLPELEVQSEFHVGQKNNTGFYTPKTGFAVKQNNP